jgi:hypothetical protein
MKFLAIIALLIITLNILLCPIVSTHLSGHEGCMAPFVNHTEDMQSFLFAVASVFIFSVIFFFISFVDLYSLNIFVAKFLYVKKVVIPDRTKINWLSILFHAPPCFK